MRHASLSIAFLTLLLSTAVEADTIVVDLSGGADHTAIADAVTAAGNGDTVLVHPGYYEGPDNSSLNFGGKRLVVRSVSGPGSTTINGYMFDNVFVMEHVAKAVVEGFTVTMTVGAALSCRYSTVEVRDCRFVRNWTNNGDPLFAQQVAVGGGRYSSVLIEDCVFSDNAAGAAISTMLFRDSDVTITGCAFSRNEERGNNIYDDPSGVISFWGSSSVTLERCSFTENVLEDCCISVLGDTDIEIRDCSFAGNRWYGAQRSAESLLQFDNTGSVLVQGCTISENRLLHGCLSLRSDATGQITDCTMTGNAGSMESVLEVTGPITLGVSMSRCILAFNDCPVPIACEGALPTISACCFFESGDPDSMCQPYDPESLILEDPLFCGFYEDDYTLCLNSPCLVPNNDWSVQIGAYTWGCAACGTHVEATSWGSIKAMYR